MTWQQWTVCAFLALHALGMVGAVGKPRRPVDSGEACAWLLLVGGLIALVVTG